MPPRRTKHLIKHSRNLLCLVLLLNTQIVLPALSADPIPQIAASQPAEPTANTVEMPKQILRTGVSLTAPGLSANSVQMADNIGLAAVLSRIQLLRSRVDLNNAPTLENISARQDLWDARQKASLIILKTDLDVDFVMAEIGAEEQVYGEILSGYTGNRDKALARINAASFVSNGILWALAEAYDVPTYKYPRLSIPSGVLGILAGVIPSVASMYTLKAVNGKSKTSEVEPNMLAKMFHYPTNVDIDYPHSVWQYMNEVPADDPKGKKRIDQLVDRWISDSNIASFTDRSSKKQLDVLTASVAQHKGLSIATLTTRQVMLQQLSSEIMKMKRMLLELTMVVQGEKQFTAAVPADSKDPRISGLELEPLN